MSVVSVYLFENSCFFSVIDVSNMGNLIRQGNFFTFCLEVGKISSSFKVSLLGLLAKIKV